MPPKQTSMQRIPQRRCLSSCKDSALLSLSSPPIDIVISSILGLTGTATFSTAVPTCLGGYEPPPPSLYHMILTAVPGSVLGQLANGAGRSSISAAMAAGSTPEWYAAIPTQVKSYISSLNANKGTGCTTPPTKTASAEGVAGATGGAGVFVDENGDLQTSTSSDFAAATQVAKGGLAGVVAFVGLMAVL